MWDLPDAFKEIYAQLETSSRRFDAIWKLDCAIHALESVRKTKYRDQYPPLCMYLADRPADALQQAGRLREAASSACIGFVEMWSLHRFGAKYRVKFGVFDEQNSSLDCGAPGFHFHALIMSFRRLSWGRVTLVPRLRRWRVLP
jgi:hypothetical protein